MADTKDNMDRTRLNNLTPSGAAAQSAGSLSKRRSKTARPQIPMPASLKLIKGDLSKYLAGQNEALLFARKLAQKVVSEEDETEQVDYILITNIIEKRKGKPISEVATPIIFFLMNCELSTVEPTQYGKMSACDVTSSKMTSRDFNASIYFWSHNELIKLEQEYLHSILKPFGFYFVKGIVLTCSVGMMPKKVGKNIFNNFEEFQVLTPDECAYLFSISQFKEREPEEELCRQKIDALLKDASNPKRFDEAIKLAKQFHDAVVVKNAAKDLISIETDGDKWYLDDSSLAFELAQSLSSASLDHAIEACSIYNRGAYFSKNAHHLMMTLIIMKSAEVQDSNMSDKEIQKLKQMHSQALYAAIETLFRGITDSDNIEILLKMIELKAGFKWGHPLNRLFSPEQMTSLINLGKDFDQQVISNMFGSILNILAETIFQYYPNLQAISSEQPRGGQDRKMLAEPELQSQPHPQAQPQTQRSTVLSDTHPVVQWFSGNLETPFPAALSPAQKAKLKLPESFKLISGNIELLLSDKNSPEKVIFAIERDDAGKDQNKDRKENENKDASENSNLKLTHLVLGHMSGVKFGNQEIDRVLTLALYFNSTYAADLQHYESISYLSNYSIDEENDIFSDFGGSELFFCSPGGWNLPFSGGQFLAFQIGLLNPCLIEFLLKRLTSKSVNCHHTIHLQELEYLKKLLSFPFPFPFEEQHLFEKIKEKLSKEKYDEALRLAEIYSENSRRQSEQQGLNVGGQIKEVWFENTNVLFLLGEYFQKCSYSKAIAAFEMISSGSPWYMKAQQKIIDIVFELNNIENVNPRENRRLREKAIKRFFIDESYKCLFNMSKDHPMLAQIQIRLNNLTRLIATQAGLRHQDLQPVSVQAIIQNKGAQGAIYFLMGLMEPLIEKLEECRRKFGHKTLQAPKEPLRFSSSQSQPKGVNGLDNPATASVKGLDEDEEDEENNFDGP